jgi:hypothetical protein
MLGERKEELNRKERDMELHTAVLAKAYARGLNPRNNRDELMELVELRGLHRDAEVDHVVEAGRLVTVTPLVLL